MNAFDFLEAPVDLWSDFDSKYEKTFLSKVKSSEVIRWGILVGKTGNKKIFCISSEGFWKAGLLKVLEVPWSASVRDSKRDRSKKKNWSVSFDVYFQDLQEPRWCALESFTTSFMKNLKCIILEQEHVILSTNSIEQVHLVHLVHLPGCFQVPAPLSDHHHSPPGWGKFLQSLQRHRKDFCFL